MNSPRHFDHLYVKGMDIELHLLSKGNRGGIPVIFLPGITSYSRSVMRMLDLMPDDYHSLALDIRGRGRSSWPKRGYRLADYVGDLLDVLNALADNPVSPVLVGHSMGARIAAAFAARHSSLVSGLVLIDPPVNGPGQRQVYPNALSMFLQQKAAADLNDMASFRSYLPSFSDAALEERADEYRNCSQQALIESYESLLREPFQIHVKAVTCPMLLLAAEHGDTIRETEFASLKALNERLRGVRVPGVGHMIYKDAPEETARHIVEFVGEHARRPVGER
jgi:N-formylmaleamate deformylase